MKRAERNRLRITFAAWLFGTFAFFIPAATWSPASRYALTRAVVERGSLAIDDFASSTGDRAQVAGRWYSEKAPLPSLAASLPYAVVRGLQALRGSQPEYRSFAKGQTPAVRIEVNRAFQQGLYVCSLFTSGVAGVAVGLLLFEFLRRRTTRRAALLGSVLVTLGTPICAYATSFYGHTPAAALVLGGLVALDPIGTHRDQPSDRRLYVAGACLASAPGCEYLAALPVALVSAWYVLRSKNRLHVLGRLALGAAVPVAIVGAYHTLAFGAPWRTGYSFIVNPQFAEGQRTGLLGITALRSSAIHGLTFGDSRGLFYVAPIALLGLAYSLRRAVVRRDWAVQAALAALGALFLLNASYFVWWGGAAAGPRHLVPCLGVVAFGLGDALRSKWSAVRLLVVTVGVLSIFVSLGFASVGIEAPEFQDVLGRFVLPNLAAGRVAVLSGASNLGLNLGLSGANSLILLAAWVSVGYWYLAAMLERFPKRSRRRAHAAIRERSAGFEATGR